MTKTFRNTASARLKAFKIHSFSYLPWAAFVLASLLLNSVCFASESVYVRDLAVPDYPVLAKMALLGGLVRVQLEIGPDGKVLSAKASGSDPILLRATEKNVRQWTFTVPPEVKDFPLKHTLIYEYKIRGDRVVNPECPTVVLHLPDRVEISAQPPVLYPRGEKKKPPP